MIYIRLLVFWMGGKNTLFKRENPCSRRVFWALFLSTNVNTERYNQWFKNDFAASLKPVTNR